MGGCVSTLVHLRSCVSVTSSSEVQDYRSRYDAVHGCFALPTADNGEAHGTPAYRLACLSAEAHAALMSGEETASMNYVKQLRTLCEERATQRAVAYRPVERVCVERVDASRELSITYLRPTCYLTYAELWERVDAFGRALLELDLHPRSHVGIFLETCVEWLVAIYGMWTQDMVAVTVYANLGKDALAYALRETSSGALVTSGAQVPMLLKLMRQGKMAHMPLVYTGTLPAPLADSTDSDGHSAYGHGGGGGGLRKQLYSFDELLELGRAQRKTLTRVSTPLHVLSTAHPSLPATTPLTTSSHSSVSDSDGVYANRNSDVALVMYTSGTTGNPKGVVHTHGSLYSGAKALEQRVVDLMGPRQPDDSYCAYLPLAHIMEFTVTNIFLARGCLIGFGSPRTLTDATARPHGDLREYKPAIVVGVPRIFDTVRKAIEAKLPPRGTLKRRIFDKAYETRLRALKEGNDTPYYNTKVFGPVREIFGGRARVMLCGGGPLSTATQEFMTVVMGPVVNGYGLTETVCIGAIQLRGDMQRSITGNLIAGSELKLVDVEGYAHTDTPEPRGEVCLRGPFLFKGYYKQPELTREVLDADGWFHTGDVGSLTADGKLRIVGRIKALAKNALGEYIALETLEALYSGHSLVLNNCVCVVVNPYKHYIAALVLTDKDKAMAFAREQGLTDVAYPELLRDKRFCAAATESLCTLATRAKRKRFEHVKMVAFVDDEWTPHNGLLTAALKLRRDAVCARYANDIEQLFAE